MMRALIALAAMAVTAPVAHAAGDGAIRSMIEVRQQQVVLQQFDLSCAAAALATILQYQHGDAVTERDVAIGLISREKYLANPELVRLQQGFSLLDLKRYAESRGYGAEGFGGLTYQDLLPIAPAIVPIRVNGYNHFVVFRGALGDTVLLADPAYGNRTMALGRFEKAWMRYAELGHVAFVVRRRDGSAPPNRLVPLPEEFALLK